MARNFWAMCLSFGLVLTLLACATRPVLAEAPPPPGDKGGAPAAASSPAIPEEEQEAEKEAAAEKEAPTVEAAPADVSAPEIDLSQWAPPPMISTGGVGQATTAAFIADGQMLDSGGVVRAEGETLAAFVGPGAIACPLGKVPTIYGGLSDTGCTVYFEISPTYPNPIQSAQDNLLTKPGWWVWVSQNYSRAGVASDLTKSLTVIGDPLGTSVTGWMALNASTMTLRDLVIVGGKVVSNGQSGALRLQGVNVTGTYANQYMIDIVGHRGSIILSGVTAKNTAGGGARLDATGPGTGPGSGTTGTGTVTVLNSAFDDNITPGYYGLVVFARNAVRVENVSTFHNGGWGMGINYRARLTLKNIYSSLNSEGGIQTIDTGTTAGPVTLQNVTANDNGFHEGVELISPGAVTGTNITANHNHVDDGFNIVNGRGSISLRDITAFGNDWIGIRIENSASSVSINGSRVVANLSGGGVHIISNGAVTVKNSIISTNDSDGLYINNTTGTLPASVTLTNNYIASNQQYGMHVFSKGTVTLSGISAYSNGAAGARVETTGRAAVTSTYGPSVFNDNGKGASLCATPDNTNKCSGLHIITKGSASINSVTANSNGWNGVKLEGSSSGRATNSSFTNNRETGLAIIIKGPITVDRVISVMSSPLAEWGGIYLYNLDAPATTTAPVTLTNATADRNTAGVMIFAAGTVTLNHVNANANRIQGIYITNHNRTGNVTISSTLGSNMITDNPYENLIILSKGSVSISGVNASGSWYASGARIINTYGTGNVSISSSAFNNNGDDTGNHGLAVQTLGSIVLNGVSANNNKGHGVDLQNQTSTLAGKTVSVSRSVFNDNGVSGANILSKGSVTLNNVVANGNNLSGMFDYVGGVYIDNYQNGAGTGNVTVSGSLGRNLFNQNGSSGLWIETAGNVSISNTETDKNGIIPHYAGIFIRSYGTAKTAVFTCVSSTNNGSYGINILTAAGSIKPTLRGVWLGGNGSGMITINGIPPVIVRVVCQ